MNLAKCENTGCGKEYPQVKSWQKFCSPECARAANKANWVTIKQSEYDELLKLKAKSIKKK